MTAADIVPSVLREPPPPPAGNVLTEAERERIRLLTASVQPDLARCRQAAHLATKLYPAPIARVVARELKEWVDFGYRFGVQAAMGELVEQVLADARERGIA